MSPENPSCTRLAVSKGFGEISIPSLFYQFCNLGTFTSVFHQSEGRHRNQGVSLLDSSLHIGMGFASPDPDSSNPFHAGRFQAFPAKNGYRLGGHACGDSLVYR